MHLFEAFKKLLETENIKKEIKNQEEPTKKQTITEYYVLFAKGTTEILAMNNGKKTTLELKIPPELQKNERETNNTINNLIKKKTIYVKGSEIYLDKECTKSLLSEIKNKPEPNKQPSTEKPKNTNSCYVLFAKDGDTFVGMHNQKKKTFRLAGIDTPEMGEAFSKEAKNFLIEQINKKVVYLEFYGTDKYDREIVDVFLDKDKKENVNKMLIEQGLAWSERYKNNKNEQTNSLGSYISNEFTEKKAFFLKTGMWGGINDDDSKKPKP